MPRTARVSQVAVPQFSRLFRRAAGTPPSLYRDAAKRGGRCEGIASSRPLFA